MNPKRIVIVGGVAGGASAAARARRLSEDAEIIVLERGPHVSFANCGLPYFIGGEINSRDSLLVQTPESLRARFNLDVRPWTEALEIRPETQEVSTRNVRTGDTRVLPYDALVIATGASPVRPPIPGIDRPGHFVVRTVPDAERIQEWIVTRAARRAVVVGGGYIGLEMAEQLRLRGLEVSVVEALPQVMAPLDPEMAAPLQEELRHNGIRLHLGDGVSAFEAPGTHEGDCASVVLLKSGERIPADLVILGLGVRPETGLARSAGLKLGTTGGIAVDDQLRTSDPHIWAVGDAVEVRDPVTGLPGLIPLAGPANHQGRLAADSIFGRPGRYGGTWGTAVLRVFSMTAACTGPNERALQRAGIRYQAVHLHPQSHAGYYPGAQPIALKILFAPDTGRLLGAQAVGKDGVDKRIDVLATALQAGMTVDDLADLELAYAPPVGSAKDPVNLAGMIAQNVRDGSMPLIQWHQLGARMADGAILLDVRTAPERAEGAIPGSRHIPLHELRKRFTELPADHDILVHCATGQRSYYATRLLNQHGRRAFNLSGAFRTWKAAKDAGWIPSQTQ